MKKFFISLIFLNLLITNIRGEVYDRILVIVGDDVITLFDLKDLYNRTREGLIKAGQVPPENLKTFILENLINQKIIKKIADEKDISISESEVDEKIDEIKANNRLTDKALKEELKKIGKTINEFREEIRNQLLTERIVALELRGSIEEPTEEEILEFYNKNKNSLVKPERLKLRHILIIDNQNAPLTERESAKKRAEMILKKALSGEKFEKLAETYSEDTTTAQIGGDLKYIANGEWLPEIEVELFKYKKRGVYPKLLYSRWGWHIVKIEDIEPKKNLELNEVKEFIKNRITAEKMDEKYKKWLEIQKNNSYIEIILENNEKYIYQNNRWKKKGETKVISNDELSKLIESLPL